jgi:hypothetical protein
MTLDSSNEFSSIDSVIAALVASYQQPESTTPVKMVKLDRTAKKPIKPSKPAKTSRSSAASEESPTTSSHDPRPAPTVSHLPQAGTVDAAGYFKMMRDAKQVNERINAIAAYIGYDPSLSYSSQELKANLQARSVHRPVKALPVPVHSVQSTIKGFVAGAFDAQEKRLADLKGRELLAGNTKADMVRQYNTAFNRGDYATAAHFLALSRVEDHRLEEIRNDLATL